MIEIVPSQLLSLRSALISQMQFTAKATWNTVNIYTYILYANVYPEPYFFIQSLCFTRSSAAAELFAVPVAMSRSLCLMGVINVLVFLTSWLLILRTWQPLQISAISALSFGPSGKFLIICFCLETAPWEAVIYLSHLEVEYKSFSPVFSSWLHWDPMEVCSSKHHNLCFLCRWNAISLHKYFWVPLSHRVPLWA